MRLLRAFVTRYPWQSIFLVVMLLLAGVADGIGRIECGRARPG